MATPVKIIPTLHGEARKKDTNALQRYGVTVQIRLYHTSKNNPISIYIFIYINIYIDIEVFYTPHGNYFWNCNTVTL